MRPLTADEIECRIGTQTDKGVSLLLYKDARVDMRMLDEEYGATNWQRHHEVVNGNLYCTISVWDSAKECWVSKQDVGTESYTDKEKGEASDSFKRAAFNWGIGRELYTAPFIWVNLDDKEFDAKGRCKTRFSVAEIDYDEKREIDHLVIIDSRGNPRYTYGRKAKKAEVTIDDAIRDMLSCTTYQDVVACWDRYPQFKKDEKFKTACTEQGVKYRPHV